MNSAQQIFLVFFAIFWGTSSNAWPKYKPFHWTFVLRDGRVACRVALSFLMLNVIPVSFFVWALRNLKGTEGVPSVRETLAGVTPAFAVFGIYRIWLGIIECSPSRFYYVNESAQPDYLKNADPTIEENLHLGGSTRSWFNLLFGVVYIVIASAAVFLSR
jgi:hypothetical protein